MRKRQLKKFAKNAKKNRMPYRRARGKGSKKDCRRLKAFNRLSRKIKQDHIRGAGFCAGVLKQIDALVPSNEQESALITSYRDRVQASLDKHREALQFDEDVKKIEEQMLAVRRVMEVYISSVRSVG